MNNAQESAFPVNGYSQEGLTKREWFAGMALQGFISSHSVSVAILNRDNAAKVFAQFADALLKELDKK